MAAKTATKATDAPTMMPIRAPWLRPSSSSSSSSSSSTMVTERPPATSPASAELRPPTSPPAASISSTSLSVKVPKNVDPAGSDSACWSAVSRLLEMSPAKSPEVSTPAASASVCVKEMSPSKSASISRRRPWSRLWRRWRRPPKVMPSTAMSMDESSGQVKSVVVMLSTPFCCEAKQVSPTTRPQLEQTAKFKLSTMRASSSSLQATSSGRPPMLSVTSSVVLTSPTKVGRPLSANVGSSLG
mmetsp:Transcript_4124/g.15938  ORF Transcript_4124/g.15938 Transcript_4124/m.15938 type:complete len:243 (+) Transcript_4124:365-1093(+)